MKCTKLCRLPASVCLSVLLLLCISDASRAMPIQHTDEPLTSENIKVDRWQFMMKPPLSIQYRRSPGSPSLTDNDSGIGLWGGSFFTNWYINNSIRILINGEDIIAQRPADEIKSSEGDQGCLRFVWKLNGNENETVTLDWSVSDDGHAVFARIQVSPNVSVDSLQVKLTCYPGGFAPADNSPSQRWVVTAKEELDVPEMSSSTPALAFTEGEEWIFYADKLTSEGSLGLIVRPEERPTGEIIMSKYQQITTLDYPAKTREVHLGFYAFPHSNEDAKNFFIQSLPAEQKLLKEAIFIDKN